MADLRQEEKAMDPEERQAIIDAFRRPWVEEYTEKLRSLSDVKIYVGS